MLASGKRKLRTGCIPLVIFLILSGCAGPPVAERPAAETSLVDGVYEGSAMGWPNRVVVRVTIADHKIVAVHPSGMEPYTIDFLMS